MTTLILANYKAETVSEGLLIHDVELSRETTKETRPDFIRDLTVDTFKQFLTHYNRRVEAGKVGAFVLLNHGGPGVGRILNLRIAGKELIADILVTHPDVIRKIEAGELTERSIEWGWSEEDAQLKGIALLSGDFGQDSEGWADLTVDVTKEELALEFEDATISMKYQQGPTKVTNTKESKMALSPEDLEQIASMIAEAMSTKVEDPAIEDEDDDPINEEKLAKALKEVAKQKLDITVDGYVRNLVSKGYTNTKHLKASFAKFGDNEMAMGVEYTRLMEKANEDITLEMEKSYEAPKLEDTLKAEHTAYCAKHDSKIDFDTFSTICQGKNKADLTGKVINSIN